MSYCCGNSRRLYYGPGPGESCCPPPAPCVPKLYTGSLPLLTADPGYYSLDSNTIDSVTSIQLPTTPVTFVVQCPSIVDITFNGTVYSVANVEGSYPSTALSFDFTYYNTLNPTLTTTGPSVPINLTFDQPTGGDVDKAYPVTVKYTLNLQKGTYKVVLNVVNNVQVLDISPEVFNIDGNFTIQVTPSLQGCV